MFYEYAVFGLVTFFVLYLIIRGTIYLMEQLTSQNSSKHFKFIAPTQNKVEPTYRYDPYLKNKATARTATGATCAGFAGVNDFEKSSTYTPNFVFVNEKQSFGSSSDDSSGLMDYDYSDCTFRESHADYFSDLPNSCTSCTDSF